MSETISVKKHTDSNPSTGSKCVTIASKMPFPFTLKLHKFQELHEAVMGGGQRVVKQAFPIAKMPTYVVNGNSYPQNVGPGERQIKHGYALTTGIPKDFWDQWLEQNKEADYVINQMIFAHADMAGAIDHAGECKDIKSGLERLDPNNLPKGLKTSDEFRAVA